MNKHDIVDANNTIITDLPQQKDEFNQIKDMRNSNLEIYRILCMFFIVLHHFAVHGLDGNEEIGNGINKYIVDILSFGGKIGVNGFVLISGYFMSKSKYSIKKYLRLEGEVWFYSVIALGASILFSKAGYNGGIMTVIKAVLPVLMNEYWFVTSFIVLMILSPFLNFVIQNLKQNQYRNLLFVLFILCSVIPTFVTSDLTSSLTWFVFLYLTAGYVRFYHNDFAGNNAIRHALIGILGILILWCSSTLINWVGIYFGKERILSYSRHFMSMESIIVLVIAYELFMTFLCMKKFSNNIVNKIAGAAFGVYLIHDNVNLRILLWQNIVKYVDWERPVYLVLYSLICVVLIYIICTVIDLIRQYTVERIWIKFVDRYGENVWCKIKHMFRKVYKFFKAKYHSFVGGREC